SLATDVAGRTDSLPQQPGLVVKTCRIYKTARWFKPNLQLPVVTNRQFGYLYRFAIPPILIPTQVYLFRKWIERNQLPLQRGYFFDPKSKAESAFILLRQALYAARDQQVLARPLL